MTVADRCSRKNLTTVQGLKKEFSYNKILKDLKKEFCCNGTVVQDPELGQVIQLQGDQRKNASTFLVQAGVVKKDNIKIHGFCQHDDGGDPSFFHKVDPSDLRKQKEKVGEAFAKHEERYKEDKDKILKWRNALTQVANIKGWHLNDRNESEFIEDIVKIISAKLCQTYPVVCNELIGINSRLEELLWDQRDVYHVLMKNTGTKQDAQIESRCLLENEKTEIAQNWQGYPLKSLPSCFQPDNLVALLLPYSRIEQLWKGTRPLYKLKMINLEGSENLIKTPDFALTPNLEVLVLESCTRLVGVHPSVGVLKRLKLLNLRGCKSLKNLPTKIGMESLQTLILSGCSNLLRFPDLDGKMECLKTLDLSGCHKVGYLPGNLQQAEFLEELDLSETAITEPPIFIFRFKHLKALSLNGSRSSKLRPNLPALFKGFQRGRTNSISLMLPLLSSLSSLTELNLSYCDLCEGDIPSGISCLSSLKRLDLSGNNFASIPASLTRLSKLHVLGLSNCSLCNLFEENILSLSSLESLVLSGNNFTSIPESLNRLSKLYHLQLSNCRELESLPELLTSINTVWIDGCISLEQVAYPSKVCNSRSGDKALFRGIHCYRLAEKINAITLLKTHLKVFANARKVFDVYIPGSEIPEWFNHQRVESSIKIPLPLSIRNDSQWMGVAFCCIFTNDDASRDEDLLCRVVIHHINSGKVGCDGSVFRCRNPREVDWSGWIIGKGYNQPIMKDHLFLRYWSRDKLYPVSSEDKCDESETENCSTSDGSDHEWDELELSVTSVIIGNCVKVKKCGARIVYEKDLEE
ncbi:hypothetical protein V6N11_016777 [Hibiscus sabdariffa]|uniref:SUI1 domain-containing protein n=1 Tax=Hibiscus sabdariffa TaxID=183260 RepID=A0ABR2TWE4_9ROSI